MRLQNILALTHGKLLNTPFVSSFTNVVFESKHVKRGDLFIAFDEKAIEEAIFNGAYGIVFSKPTQISDSEIAWIKVESIEDTLKRLLRFKLLEKNLCVYETNEIVLKLALQVITEPNFIVVYGDMRTIFELLWDAEHNTTLLFCPLLSTSDIFPQTIELSNNPHNSINIIEQTLFETSFIFDDIFYERQLLSPFFIPYLEILLQLFKTLKINYRLKKFTSMEHFEAVFTNKKFEIKEFGTSDKVLIFEKSTAHIEAQILFLQREATWAKTLYILPFTHKKSIEQFASSNTCIFYKNTHEIITLLKENNFHFALIIGVDKDILSAPLNNQRELDLFDFK